MQEKNKEQWDECFFSQKSWQRPNCYSKLVQWKKVFIKKSGTATGLVLSKIFPDFMKRQICKTKSAGLLAMSLMLHYVAIFLALFLTEDSLRSAIELCMDITLIVGIILFCKGMSSLFSLFAKLSTDYTLGKKKISSQEVTTPVIQSVVGLLISIIPSIGLFNHFF